jgi:hypothetical protein
VLIDHLQPLAYWERVFFFYGFDRWPERRFGEAVGRSSVGIPVFNEIYIERCKSRGRDNFDRSRSR